MRTVLLSTVIVIACGAGFRTTGAQALVASWHPAPDVEYSRVALSRALAVSRDTELPARSTLAERFIGGLVIGGAVGLVAAERFDNEPVVIAYTVGSAAGVLVATAARERPRPVRILLGVALGALPLLAVASERDGPFSVPLLLVGAVTTPLLGAVGQPTR